MSSPSSSSSTPSPVHLLVLVHGLWGSAEHVGALATAIKDVHTAKANADGEPELNVLSAEGNENFNTFDGVDWGAERIVKEIDARIESIEKDADKQVTRFSMTGYSFGGLAARYVIGILLHRGFFNKVTPVNFNTFATPHIGIPRFQTFVSSLVRKIGSNFLGRTGAQFYAEDKWADDKPLLVMMAEKDSIFYKALMKFPVIAIYANAVDDHTVPYVTAAIEEHDPFIQRKLTGLEITLDEKYEPLIKSTRLPDTPPPPPKPAAFLSAQYFEELPIPRPPKHLQFRFPLNVLFYAATPIVAPVVIGTLLTRFSLEDRASRKRIKCLEKGGSEDAERRSQLKILEQMEEELDEVVTSLVGVDRKESLLAAHPPSPPASSPAPPSTSSSAASSTTSLPNSSTSPSADDCKNAQPALTPAQRRMISNLNAIPHLEKRVAMCDTGVYNHGTIVCRQPKRLPLHARGAGIVKHWADFWVL